MGLGSLIRRSSVGLKRRATRAMLYLTENSTTAMIASRFMAVSMIREVKRMYKSSSGRVPN